MQEALTTEDRSLGQLNLPQEALDSALLAFCALQTVRLQQRTPFFSPRARRNSLAMRHASALICMRLRASSVLLASQQQQRQSTP